MNGMNSNDMNRAIQNATRYGNACEQWLTAIRNEIVTANVDFQHTLHDHMHELIGKQPDISELSQAERFDLIASRVGANLVNQWIAEYQASVMAGGV